MKVQEKIVRNVCSLFPHIHGFPPTVNLFLSLVNHQISYKDTLFKVKGLIYPWDRHIHKV